MEVQFLPSKMSCSNVVYDLHRRSNQNMVGAVYRRIPLHTPNTKATYQTTRLPQIPIVSSVTVSLVVQKSHCQHLGNKSVATVEDSACLPALQTDNTTTMREFIRSTKFSIPRLILCVKFHDSSLLQLMDDKYLEDVEFMLHFLTNWCWSSQDTLKQREQVTRGRMKSSQRLKDQSQCFTYTLGSSTTCKHLQEDSHTVNTKHKECKHKVGVSQWISMFPGCLNQKTSFCHFTFITADDKVRKEKTISPRCCHTLATLQYIRVRVSWNQVIICPYVVIADIMTSLKSSKNISLLGCSVTGEIRYTHYSQQNLCSASLSIYVIHEWAMTSNRLSSSALIILDNHFRAARWPVQTELQWVIPMFSV